MTLDEAIAHCREKAAIECGQCADEYAELAEWLQELKNWREQNNYAYPNMHVYLYHADDADSPFADLWTQHVPDVGEKTFVWDGTSFTSYIVKLRVYGCNAVEKVGVWNLYLEKAEGDKIKKLEE